MLLLKVGKRYINPNLIATVETGVRALHPDHHGRRHDDKFSNDAVVVRVLGSPEALELFDADARAFVVAVDPGSQVVDQADGPAAAETPAASEPGGDDAPVESGEA